MKTDPRQDPLLSRLAAKHRELKLAELTVKERVERQLQEELSVLRVERSQLAIDAFAAGASKTRIGRAVGTSDWGTVNSLLKLAAPTASDIEVAQAEADAKAAADETPWEYDEETHTLTLHRWTGEDSQYHYGHRTLNRIMGEHGYELVGNMEGMNRYSINTINTRIYMDERDRGKSAPPAPAPAPYIDPMGGWGILPEDLEEEDED